MLEASWFSISFRNRMFDSRKVSNPNNIVWQIIRKSNKHNYSEHSAINLSKGTLSVFCFLCRLQYLMPLLGHVWSSFGIRLLILRGSLKGNLNAFGLYNAGRYVSLSRIRIGTAPQERKSSQKQWEYYEVPQQHCCPWPYLIYPPHTSRVRTHRHRRCVRLSWPKRKIPTMYVESECTRLCLPLCLHARL